MAEPRFWYPPPRNTANLEASPQDLEAAGIPPKHDDAIAHRFSVEVTRAIRPRRGPSAITILATDTPIGFGLLTAVSGWFLIDASHQRTEIRTAIEANRDGIGTLGTRLSTAIAGPY